MTVNGNTDGRRSGKMSKNIENAILLDTYGSMLTEKQYDTLSLYYDEDLSLSEIAENMGITRQGVHKCIRTAEEYLTQLEIFLRCAYALVNAQRRNISLSLRKHSDLRKSTAMSVIYATS